MCTLPKRTILRVYGDYLVVIRIRGKNMILETALLDVIKGKELEFENSFKKAQTIISYAWLYIPSTTEMYRGRK